MKINKSNITDVADKQLIFQCDLLSAGFGFPSGNFIFGQILRTPMSSQIVMTYPNKRPVKVLPYAFTEQGVAMLSGILSCDKAINMNIAIMRAFVEIRRVLLQKNDLKEQFKAIRDKLGEYDAQLNQIYDAMENLLDEKAAGRKWEEREQIGFVK